MFHVEHFPGLDLEVLMVPRQATPVAIQPGQPDSSG